MLYATLFPLALAAAWSVLLALCPLVLLQGRQARPWWRLVSTSSLLGLGRRTGFRVWGVVQVLAFGSAALRLWGFAVGWWLCRSSLFVPCRSSWCVDAPGAVQISVDAGVSMLLSSLWICLCWESSVPDRGSAIAPPLPTFLNLYTLEKIWVRYQSSCFLLSDHGPSYHYFMISQDSSLYKLTRLGVSSLS